MYYPHKGFPNKSFLVKIYLNIWTSLFYILQFGCFMFWHLKEINNVFYGKLPIISSKHFLNIHLIVLLIVSRRPKIAKVMCNKSGDVRIKKVKQKKVWKESFLLEICLWVEVAGHWKSSPMLPIQQNDILLIRLKCLLRK